jgi:hypothetical protein
MNDDRLRTVALGDTGYKLTTWDTGRHAPTGQRLLSYEFVAPDGTVLFKGADYGCSPMHCIDSDAALRGLIGFLTTKPGDTDPDYFENYTPEQLAFCEGDAEMLQDWGMEPDGEHEPPKFVGLD